MLFNLVVLLSIISPSCCGKVVKPLQIVYTSKNHVKSSEPVVDNFDQGYSNFSPENQADYAATGKRKHVRSSFQVNSIDSTSVEKSLFEDQVDLGEIKLNNTIGFLAGYAIDTMAIRYAPPPHSDPWPMPQTFFGYTNLYEIDSKSIAFNVIEPSSSNGVSECSSLQSIINRYRGGLLFATARRLAINDATLHPGAVYIGEKVKSKKSSTAKTSAPESENKPKSTSVEAITWQRQGIHITEITISVSEPCSEYPTAKSSEMYSLRITDKGIAIEAIEVWGVLYAMETLSQLIFVDATGKFIVREASVKDWPRFRHRGILLDSSRHFLPMSILKKNIDAMVQNKFNVFHWHLSDDQSFPLYLASFPEFAKLAAFSPKHIYKPNDVRELVEYARVRGVRIIPEIDTPGHVLSWRHLPIAILTRCYNSRWSLNPNGDLGPLDPSNEDTYGVLAKILGDVATLFPDSGFHAGGDEVPMECWQLNPNITKYRQEKFNEKMAGKTGAFGSEELSPKSNYDDDAVNEFESEPMISLQELTADYNKRLLSIFVASRQQYSSGRNAKKPQMIMWEDAIENDPYLSRDVTLHVWKSDQDRVTALAKDGYSVIFSKCWYLNYISYGLNWIDYYRCDPTMFEPNDEHADLLPDDHNNVLGGEVCLWGEYIDETNLISTLWPRASAVAERLWSSRYVNSVVSAGRRLEEHRCRMLSRGIGAAPLSGPGTCESGTVFVSASEL